MKSNSISGILIITAVVFLTACSKKGPSYTKFIPKDASFVVAMDIKSMMAKLEKDTLSVENMLQVIKDSANPSKYSKAIEMWQQFKDAGLDFDNKMLVAGASPNRNERNVEVQVIAGLKEEQKLEAFIAKMPDATRVIKESGFTYAVADDWVVGWNKDAVMFLGESTTPKQEITMISDTTGTAQAPAQAPALEPGSNMLMVKMKKYFTLKEDESMASVDAFTDLVAEKADMAIYSNSGNLAGTQAGMGLAMMPKVKELLDGIFTTTLINFEDGKMVIKSSTSTGPKMADILKKYAGPVVDMSLINPYPSNNVGGVAAFSFNPELIPALLKETGFDAIVDMGLGQQGITTADIVKAFKGDFAVIFSDFSLARVEKTAWDGNKYMGIDPTANLLVTMRIGDKAAFEKVLGLATKTGAFVRQGNRLVPASRGIVNPIQKFFLGIENDLVVFSNDEAIYKAYVAKSSKIGLTDEAQKIIKGSSIAFYINAQQILNGIPENIFDSTSMHQKNVALKAKSIFKTASFTTSNFDGKKINGEGQVIMISDKNSLPQLVRFLMYAATEMKMKQAADSTIWNHNEAMTDSSMITPGK